MLFLGTLRATSIQFLSKTLAFRLSAIGLISALVLSPLSPISPLNTGQNAEAVSTGASPCEQSVSNSSTATVGRIQNVNGVTVDCYVKFTSGTNSWVPPVGVSTIRLLVVGGGGSGAGDIGGGGGAGEFVESDTFSVSSSTIYPITIGAGGRDNDKKSGWAGENSRFGDIIAYGGGGGLSQYGDDGVKSSTTEGFSGLYYGSSGGGGFLNTYPQTQSYPVRQSVALNNNSRGLPYGVYAYRGNGGNGSGGGGADATAGGGGGATGWGANGSSLTQSGGSGGEGKSSDITGVSLWYAGGGGGGVNGAWGWSAGTPGSGGSGVGGAGGAKATVSGGGGSIGENAVANTGSGGGGASNAAFGGQGAAGVVIVRYQLNPPTNSSLPVISGSAIEGHTLHVSAGNWSNASGAFQYQWQSSSNQTTWTNISGATKNSFTLTSNESAKYLRVAVTASNGTGSTTAQSTATSSVDSTATQACSQSVTNSSTIEVTALTSNSVVTECVVKFTSGTNTWTKPAGVSNVRLLLVGGGGAGGAGIGGGGGAGEMVEVNSFALSGNSFSVGVGAMGNATQNAGNSGGNSTFSTITAYGGGGGGYNENVGPTPPQGINGYYFGSAGGGAFPNTSGTGLTQVYGVHTEYYRNVYPIIASRNPAGFGSGGGGDYATGGGGGGAGSNGVGGSQSSQSGGAGGDGLVSNITGTSLFYAAGGGGGVNGDTGALSRGNPGFGGSGIGGSGGGKGPSCTNRETGARELLGSTSGCWGYSGVPNTGSGGGGASNSTFGGDGGSGVVILRYSLASQSALSLTPTTTTYGTTQTLSTSGGSGTGTVTYALTSSGTALCSLSGATLSFTTIGTCSVTASKASAGGYLPVNTLATTVTVGQASLGTVSAPTVAATSGIANSIDVSWSAVTDADTYYVKLFRADTNVEVAQKTVSNATSTTLTATDFANIGTIQNYKVSVGAASSTGNYSLGTQSSQVAVTTNIAQSTLSVTSVLATFGSTRALATSGGSGTGSVTYSVTSAGTANCSVSGSTLSYTAAGSCTVTATKAASTGYLAASSTATTITVNPASMGTVATPTVTATSGVVNSIDVSWSAVTNADSYQIKLYTADTDVMVAYKLVSNVTSYTFTSSDYSSIANSRNYKITVAAYSSTGNYQDGSESTKVAVTTNTQVTVSYSYAGATGGNSTSSVNYITGATALTLPTPTKTGYTLSGWFTSSSAGTKIGNGGASYSPSSTLTLYAQWTANSNTVTFNANDGSGSPSTSTQSITTDQATALAANTFVRQGYMFSSWNTVALGGGLSYTNSQSVTLTGPLNLYAQWTANTYTVTYNYNGANGGNSTTSDSFTVGGSQITLPVPTKTGYSFAGWFDNSGFTGSALGNTYAPTSTLTVYAKWSANLNTVSFNANDGTGSPATSSQSVTSGVSTNLTANSFTRTGYSFAGWATTANGAVAYADQASVTITSGLSLFATWTANTYTVTYNYNSATGGNGTASSNFTVNGTQITLPVPTKTGYTFAGWFEASNFTGSAISGTYAPSSTRTIYAKWNANTYTVTYDYNGADGSNSTATDNFTSGGTQITLPVPTKTGYTFAGWFDNSGFTGSTLGTTYGPTSTGTVYAKWTANTYTVTYNYNSATGGNTTTTANYTVGGTQITLPAPTRTGYTFGGWYEALNLSGSALSGTYAPSSTRTVYAKWTANTYSVTYNYNSATGGNTTVSDSYTVDSTQISLPAPTRTGYTFAGWFENSGLSGSAISGTYAPSSTLTIYAKWTANTYTVTYSYNGANGGNSSVSGSYTTAGSQLSLPAPTRTGYTFAGWFDNSGLTGSALGNTYTTTSSVTIYAKWTANNNTVTFNANDGSGTPATTTQTIVSGAATALSINGFTRTGYTFANWNTAANGSGTSYNDQDSVTITGGFTLYAQWQGNTFTVTYDYDNATSGNTNATGSYTVGGSALILPIPSRTGYTFEGWFDNSSFTGSPLGMTYSPSSSRTIYASWSQIMCAPVTTISQGYTVYSFNAIGTCEWTVPAGVSNVQALVVAGGGGGGYSWDNTGAGGGAGGQAKTGNLTLGSSITINVGEGGVGGNTSSRRGGTGGSSSVSTISTLGGTGGCAGRATCVSSGSPATANAAAVGGSGGVGGSAGRGGGGSSVSGAVTTNTAGGSGTAVNYTGTLIGYGAGGPGGSPRGALGNVAGVPGIANTGRGGGGASAANSSGDVNGGAGGTGVIILRVANTYALSYEATDAASGAPSATSGSYTTGSTAITLPTQNTMLRPGYTFAGWSTTAGDAATRVTNSGSYTVSAATTLYALWTAIGYSATYSSQNADTGSVPTDSTSYNIGNTLLIKANTGNLARTGYSFAGWVLNPDGSGTVYQSGDSITISTSNITLYPKWTANTYTVTYNTNGALSGTPSRTSDSYTTGNAGLSLPNVGTMVKTGYDFQGWSTSPTGSALSGSYTTSSNVTLYAIWTLKPVAYTYNRGTANSTTLTGSHVATTPNLSAQSSVYGTIINLDTTISRTITVNAASYQFMGWNDGTSIYSPGDAYTLGDTSRTFTAEWVRIFEVRYVLNGGTGIVDIDDECHGAGNTCTDGQGITLSAAPTRSGYTFAGWKDQSGATKQASAGTTITASSFLFSAQWDAIDYTFTFNTVGGSATPANLVKNIGQIVTLPSPGSKPGYTFAGWFDGTRTWGEGATVTVGTSGAGFIALWTADVYTVAYDWNGGAGTPTSNASYTYGTTALTLPTGSGHTRDGYVFDGWSTTPGGSAVGTQYTPSASTLLYARWADGDFAVTLNSHGGTLSQSSYQVARNSSMTLPTPTRAGFVFEGWYEGVSTGTHIGAGQASFTPAASRTLHARWVQNSLAGINPAHINTLASITVTGSHTWSGTHSGSGTGASLNIPQGSLPTGTQLNVSFIEDLTRQRDLIDVSYAYYTSVAVHWLTGTGDSATVPTVSGNTPVSLTLTNPSILPGAKVFMILGGVATEVAQATQAGQVTIQMTQDPEFVIAATQPTAPASVSATSVSNASATVSWTAPTSTGGAPVTSYTVTATPGGATCVTTSLSCSLSGLSDGVSYSYAVTADNAVGSSPVRSTTVAYVPPAPVATPINVIPVSSGNTPSTVPVTQVAMSAERSGVSVVSDAEQTEVEDDVDASSSGNNSSGDAEKDSDTDAEQPVITFWWWILLLLIALIILILLIRKRIVARR